MNDHVSFRFQAENLLNTPLRLYDNNNESQIARNDVYGRRYLLDMTFRFKSPGAVARQLIPG